MPNFNDSNRLTLRNLHPAQKLLVAAILATVGVGYISALANLFAQDASADGLQTIELEDFASVFAKKGVLGLLEEVQRSLGVNDVIRKYHGSGNSLRLQTALDGSMKTKILENVTGGDASDPKMAAYCETLRQDLIVWAKLPVGLRRRSYAEGVPFKGEEGLETTDFEKLQDLFGPEGTAPKTQIGKTPLKPLISGTFKENCVTCHATGSTDTRAKGLPLDKFEAIDQFCKLDHGISMKQLALTTHVHLLGFAVLFAMTGFLFSLTSYSGFTRVVVSPFTLTVQLMEICCWWLAKTHIGFAYGIFYLGPLVGLGLLIQILGIFFDLVFRRRTL